ncbi:MAG: type II secretion system protein [Candidatus Riflebacteria bacterium]|nr:type II secretion system protein [Candidatus Riflebacteria bacterium]
MFKRERSCGGFTLPEVLIASGIIGMLIGMVFTLYSWHSKAVNRITWHSETNRKASLVSQKIIQMLEKSSVPSVIAFDSTKFSDNTAHYLNVPNGSVIKAGSSRKRICTFPCAVSSTPTAQGKINWVELSLSELKGDTADLDLSETLQYYTDSSYATVGIPAFSKYMTLIENVDSVEIEEVAPQTLRIKIKAIYPQDKRLSQVISIDCKTNITVAIKK